MTYYGQPDLSAVERPLDLIRDPLHDESLPGTVSSVGRPWKQFVVPMDLNFGDSLTADGTLELLRAGQWNQSDYFEKLHTFDVHKLYAVGGASYIERLRREWKHSYDFVLIDCRSGITPLGSICTIQLPDTLVLLLQCDERDIVGGTNVAEHVTTVRYSLPFDRMELLTIPILARFDRERLPTYEQHWLEHFERALPNFYDPWLPKELSKWDILKDTSIPISGDDDERLPSLRQKRPAHTAIAKSFENIAALIANDFHRVTSFHSDREVYINQAWKNVPVTRILSFHDVWMKTNHKHGEQANFSGRDCRLYSFERAHLSEAVFTNANLSSTNLLGANVVRANFAGAELKKANLEELIGVGTNFRNADLQEASLIKADLRSANLQSAKLAKADLKDAKLYRAILAEATLEDVKNLTVDQLRAVNLAGATLPKDLYEFDDLREVLSQSRHARDFFFILAGFCGYSVFVLWNTSDFALLTNESAGAIAAGIPAMWFVYVGPLVLLVSYAVFLRLIQQLWKRLVNLPAIFPNGETLNEKVSNWFTAAVAYPNLGGKVGLIPKWQRLILGLLTRFLIPATQLFFWWKSLPLRNIPLILFHCFLVAFTVALAWSYQRLGRITLQTNNTGEHWLPEEVDQPEIIEMAA